MDYATLFALIDTNLASGTKIPAIKHREVEHALLDYIQANLTQSGDIKPIKCDITYLNDNFEPSGLGKNLRLGWAICNGNTHSGQQMENIAGKTIVGFGGSFTTFSQEIGSPDAVLVEHSHNTVSVGLVEGVFSSLRKFLGSLRTSGANLEYDLQGRTNAPTTGETSTVGVSGTDKNYQPSIILLYIQKL